MSTNGFREDELVSRKVKVGNEWQTRVFPVVGGRLRLAHEENQNLNLKTEMVSWDGQFAIFKCSAVTTKGQFVGYGTANAQRDARLADSLVELAETRSVARALRFAGFGLEFTGAEEVSHVAAVEPEREERPSKEAERVFPQDNGNGKAGTKASNNPVGPSWGERLQSPEMCSRARDASASESALCPDQTSEVRGRGHSEHAGPVRSFPL